MIELDLFRPEADAEPVPLAALAAGAVLSISVSGGKDSQALMLHVLDLRDRYGWPGPVEIVHADLGRAEWPQTPAHVERMAEEAARIVGAPVPLVVVQREKGDLVQRIEERLNTVSTLDPTRPAKPFWPSPAQRYCTSDQKRGPIQKHVRTHGRDALLVSVQGMRAAESAFRAKAPRVALDKSLSGKAYRNRMDAGASLSDVLEVHREQPEGRLALTWLPIHDWPDGRVWQRLDTSAADLDQRRALMALGERAAALDGWQAHEAYVLGNERLSCSLCVLASRSDLLNGIRHNRPLAEHYAGLEARTGYTFQDGQSITDLIAEVDGCRG